LSGIAPVPTRSVKIVPVCVLDDFAALWVDCVFHDCLIVFHHFDFVVQLFYQWAVVRLTVFVGLDWWLLELTYFGLYCW
jgi:hypothetical protein